MRRESGKSHMKEYLHQLEIWMLISSKYITSGWNLIKFLPPLTPHIWALVVLNLLYAEKFNTLKRRSIRGRLLFACVPRIFFEWKYAVGRFLVLPLFRCFSRSGNSLCGCQNIWPGIIWPWLVRIRLLDSYDTWLVALWDATAAQETNRLYTIYYVFGINTICGGSAASEFS